MLYNCGMIFFFILSFFVSYILSFGLVRLWTVQLLVQVFTLTRGGCDNHICHNKNRRYKMGLRCEWRHARKRWAGNFDDFWKKQWVEIWTGIHRAFVVSVSWDSTLNEASWDLYLGQSSPAGDYGMHRAFVGSDGTVSIVKIVSLSPRVERLNSRSQ